ncbi:MAG: hypothetical protein IJD48_03925 [Clostridia bacterium]|nr:hypothetical protein [Clostridia bacterium]
MQSILHIKPDFDCLLKSSKTEIFLKANSTNSFLTSTQKITLLFYPTNCSEYSLPFCFVFDAKNPCHSKNVKVANFNNNNYLLSVSPFFISKPQNLLFSTKKLKTNSTEHTIFFNTNSDLNLKIESDLDVFSYNFDVKIKQLKCVSLNQNILIYAHGCHGGVVVLLDYTQDKYKIILCEKVDILEETNSTLKTYKCLYDFAGHGVVNTFDLNKSLLPNTQLVYANKSPFLAKHKEIIPYAFFEAIKVNNLKVARFYLSTSLSNKLSDKHLKVFFDNFDDIQQSLATDSIDEIALIYNNDKCNKTKLFKLEFDNQNKISNITELN